MTLKEKMKVEIMNLPIMDEVIDYIGKELEYVADDFAIGFGEWLEYGSEYVDNTERGKVYYFRKKLYTTKELLEMYKKEKGL